MKSYKQFIEETKTGDPELFRLIQRQARKVALVGSIFVVMANVAFVYGYIQKTQADYQKNRVEQIQAALDTCQKSK